ncbi:CBS domain-containing protein [Desulfolucanica intricata]|uniref:CBS domain-containing protein n=1 Tax=Desulfolucanica intricata TaxID=1285191 RepID=UPI001EE4EAD6|nr:CBS domain-containing protein [Desulfolucanica intricata]
MLVKDIMVPLSEYTAINENATLGEAISTLKRSFKKEANNIVIGHRSAVVLNDNNGVAGILTLRSILEAVEFEASKHFKWTNFTSWAGYFFNKNNLTKHTSLKVKDIMRSINPVHVNTNDTVLKAVHTILTYKVNTLPVIEEETEVLKSIMREYPVVTKKVVGIVRTIDIFDIIGELLEVDNKIITFPVCQD